jgi:putative ABC transport system permease protein
MTDREFLEIPRRERPQLRTVSPGYLPAMSVRLLDGRWLNEDDRPGRPRVVLVNRAYAQRYLNGRKPVGVVLRQGIYPVEVVGVVDDIRMRTLDGVIEPAVFADTRQTLSTLGEALRGSGLETLIVGPSGAMSFAVRVSASPGSIGSDLQTLVAQIDPAGAVEGLAPLDEIVSGTIARPRFYAVLVTVFGAIAGLLAAIGIYGVLAYSTSRRMQEFGIRLALGATPRQVQALALGQGVVLIAVGIPAGLLIATGVSRSLSGLLFEVTPLDMRTYAVVAISFAAVSLAALYVPARRATGADPLVALRYE